MPNDSEGDEHSSSRVEKMLNALDELQEAVDRLAAERRTSGRLMPHDLTLVKPLSREEPQPPKRPVPRF